MMRVISKAQFNPDIEQDVIRAIMRLLFRVGGTARTEAVIEAPKDTGQLINGIHQITPRPDFLVGGISTSVVHAVPMEDGRAPGTFPPPGPILRWVLRHRSSFNLPSGRAGAKKAKQIAFLVGRKIFRKGIKGKKFFKAAEIKITKDFGRQIEALGLDIQTAWNEGG